MRLSVLFILSLLAGCAGNVADYVGSRSGIVSPQLIRFGLDLAETRCVGERIGAALSPLQLRRLVRAASLIRRGALAQRLVPQDLVHVARTMNEAQVPAALDSAYRACGMDSARIVGGVVAPAPLASAPAAPAGPPSPVWLNLGAAGSGQSIAVDAASLEQDAATRTAWFRLTNPEGPPNNDAYLLKVDCRARTINAKARERRGPAGAVSERVDYPDNPLPVENGTVMEIAFLAMCT